MSALVALLDQLPRAVLLVGKGGVGKTTCAVELARAFARRSERTLLISTDPAAALADVLGAPIGTDATPVPMRGRSTRDSSTPQNCGMSSLADGAA